MLHDACNGKLWEKTWHAKQHCMEHGRQVHAYLQGSLLNTGEALTCKLQQLVQGHSAGTGSHS